MALADLRALARRKTPTPEPATRDSAPRSGTPGTPNRLPTGSGMDAPKTQENRRLQEAGTPGTRRTRDLSNGGGNEPAAPATDPLATVPDEGFGVLTRDQWAAAMSEALMANPVYRIGNRDRALEYFRTQALRLWDTTPDAYARGLLLGAERHRHVLAVRKAPAV